jgi:hypothetical protein
MGAAALPIGAIAMAATSTQSASAVAIAPLDWHERLYYRDHLRSARYTALADAEGFQSVCYALEALGMRLLGKRRDLGRYSRPLRDLAIKSTTLTELAIEFPSRFSSFDGLFAQVRIARNDAMHSGVYARHATAAAIEVCIGLEEALMNQIEDPRTTVADFMVKSAVVVESWQPVAHARQLMLTHSFSFLPVYLDRWKLVSEIAVARFLRGTGDWKSLMSMPVGRAADTGLALLDARVVKPGDSAIDLLNSVGLDRESARLWLVEEGPGRLCGVLSPFELM